MLERVLADGLVAVGAPVVAMLSGGRDSVCLLDLAVRGAGPQAVTALHVNYGLRDDCEEDERHCAALCESLGVALEIERPQRPEGPGNLQAWARDTRYAAAIELAQPRRATILTGHTADDQVETILYRLASSPSRRALLGMRPHDGALARPLLGFTRDETTAYCEQRGLAWREDSSNAEPIYARNRVRHGLLPELARIHPAAAQNVLRTAALLRDEAEVLDALVEAEVDGSSGSARGTISLARLQELPPALRRLVVQRLADGAAGQPVPGAARFAEQVTGLRRTGTAALDLGSGVRAVVERGVLRAERRARTRLRRVSDPAIGETLVAQEDLQRRVAELGAEVSRDYAGRDLVMVGVLKGAVLFLADLMRSIDVPCEIDFMAVSSYGSQTDTSGVVRILKDLDAPIEGRHVLIVEDIIDSGLTLHYLMRNLKARNPASLEVCALLTKPERLRVDLSPRYVGFEIANRFAIGYGLDHAQRYRNLNFVAALADQGA